MSAFCMLRTHDSITRVRHGHQALREQARRATALIMIHEQYTSSLWAMTQFVATLPCHSIDLGIFGKKELQFARHIGVPLPPSTGCPIRAPQESRVDAETVMLTGCGSLLANRRVYPRPQHSNWLSKVMPHSHGAGLRFEKHGRGQWIGVWAVGRSPTPASPATVSPRLYRLRH